MINIGCDIGKSNLYVYVEGKLCYFDKQSYVSLNQVVVFYKFLIPAH